MKNTIKPSLLVCAASAAVFLVLSGCSKSGGGETTTNRTLKPKEAASQLEQAFVSANVEVKQDANVASTALRTADYEKAIQSLHSVKQRGNLTLEQGMAVHNSMVALEGKLIAGMNAGDANAKRAYELLKQLSRD